MQINIKATNLDLTPSIREYIETKIGALGRYLKRFESGESKNLRDELQFFIEIARTTKHHHKGNVFYAEANLRLFKKALRVEHSDSDIRIAIDRMKDKMSEEIRKYSDKNFNYDERKRKVIEV